MLKTYFKREQTRTTYAAGPAGPYLDDFSHWLEKRGFTTRTIRHCLFGATQYVRAEAVGVPVQDLDATILDAFEMTSPSMANCDMCQVTPLPAAWARITSSPF